MRVFRPLLFSIAAAILLGGCDPYARIQKSEDLVLKYDAAVRFYEKGDYFKAYPLIEELVTYYRGTSRAEKLYYYYAYCDYYIGDYYLAGYRFKNFTKIYGSSHLAEECAFMSAYCYYINSPKYSLDQEDTHKAMTELQIFINRYPESPRLDSCNMIMTELRNKLERKSFEISKQYYHTHSYKAALVSFENTLLDFPDTRYREEIMYLQVKSAYLLAVNSVQAKKEGRIDDTVKSYFKFANSFPRSAYLTDAENIYKSSLKEKERLQKLNTQTDGP